MKIQIVGPQCIKSTRLAENATAAASQLGIEYELETISDSNLAASLGVIASPGLIINGEVRIVGRVPSREELKHLYHYLSRNLKI